MYMYRREGGRSRRLPRIGGVQWSTTVESTLWSTGDHGAGRAGVLGIVLGPAEIVLASLWPLQMAWWSLWRVCPPGVAWRRPEGPAGRGLEMVKARAAFEGRAHTYRGFCSIGRYTELAAQWRQQCRARQYRASQVLTVLPQGRGWRSSDWSRRTRLRSRLLCGVVA